MHDPDFRPRSSVWALVPPRLGSHCDGTITSEPAHGSTAIVSDDLVSQSDESVILPTVIDIEAIDLEGAHSQGLPIRPYSLTAWLWAVVIGRADLSLPRRACTRRMLSSRSLEASGASEVAGFG